MFSAVHSTSAFSASPQSQVLSQGFYRLTAAFHPHNIHQGASPFIERVQMPKEDGYVTAHLLAAVDDAVGIVAVQEGAGDHVLRGGRFEV